MQIELKKAFSFLESLKEQLQGKGDIEETYINLYHNELDRLAKLSFEGLEEYRIPEREIKNRITGHDFSRNAVYSDEKFVKETYFMFKLNSLLSFFSILTPEIEIGFIDKKD